MPVTLLLLIPALLAAIDQGGHIHAHKFHQRPAHHVIISAPLAPRTETITFVGY